MRLLLLNGSPRGNAGNTAVLMKQFTDGFTAQKGVVETVYLIGAKDHPALARKFLASDAAIIAFPLYADSMPSVVKEFIEAMGEAVKKARRPFRMPRLGFVVQSGFPETIHSRFVEKYLQKLARRLGARYSGTVIRGGAEGTRVQPPWMNRRMFVAFRNLGRHFAVTGEFHPLIMRDLAGRERMSALARIGLRIMPSSLLNMYWNKMLKMHGAYDRRFDRPYEPGKG